VRRQARKAVSVTAARRLVAEMIRHAFGEAADMAGSHAPFAIGPEREAFSASCRVVIRAIYALPDADVIAAAERIRVIDEIAREEIDEAERAWEKREARERDGS
jgi:hypothetical protein